MAELIETHNLRDRLNLRGRRPMDVKLTTSTYRGELGKLVHAHKKPTIKTKVDAHRLFQKGSRILDDKYLAKLNYKRPAPRENQDSDDEPETEDEEDEGQREEDVVDGSMAEPQDPDSGSSATAAETIEVPNSIAESSQEIEPSVEEAQEAGSKKRIAPTVLSTPRSKSVPETKKRKRNNTDEDVPERMIEPVPRLGIVEIPERRTTDPDEVAPQGEARLSQMGRPLESASVSKAPSLESLSAATLSKLSNNELIKNLNAIWAGIQNVALNLETEMNDPAVSVHLHLHPNPEPMFVFLRVFGGRNWQKRASELIHTDVVNKGGFVEAIFSAATYELVFESGLPWSHPKQILEVLSDKQKYFDQVLSVPTKATGLCMHTVVWQGAILEAEDKDFHQHTVRPYAKDLAQKFMMHVSGLLKTTWTRKPAKPEAFWKNITEQVAAVFGKALILRRQMEVAPDYYRWAWIESGAAFENTRMEELHDSTGEQEVVWTLTPLIEKRQTQDAEWQMLCSARVLTRPKSEV